MTSQTPRTAPAYRGEPSRDELAAAQQVVDLFATEALLALDRFERSFPAAATDRERRVADRLAHWWKKLELDDVRLDPAGTDAEQILGAAADLSLDPENDWGTSLEEASAQAVNRAALDGRTMPVTTVADLRRNFDEAYGGQVSVPDRDDEWLAQSLTRFARASVLRDVIAEGAHVRVSEPLREAADELVRQAQQLMDDRRNLARRQEAPIGKRELVMQQINRTSLLFAYSTGVGLTGAPEWVEWAARVPAVVIYAKAFNGAWRDHDLAVATRLDPAQAQLRSVRADLINNLDGPSPVTRRDARALRNPNRPTGPGR
ncbi:hypothetical protein [Kribbella shirazensis]|uniref:Uncharacterized protein n=1 Tax=Kribbella shirazensis TaxID=1105143 RepID=A0A7X5VCZ4_9ACTN|nr:hypothetical protein [Kribbella shirazensis]NIK58709.1 hypothetical protein [Kribbella shirazensis]